MIYLTFKYIILSANSFYFGEPTNVTPLCHTFQLVQKLSKALNRVGLLFLKQHHILEDTALISCLSSVSYTHLRLRERGSLPETFYDLTST